MCEHMWTIKYFDGKLVWQCCKCGVVAKKVTSAIKEKPMLINYYGKTVPYCPVCENLLLKVADEDYKRMFEEEYKYMNYCDNCGQEIDWSDENDI